MARDRMQRQRFELKYVLNEDTALRVRDFVLGYLSCDEAGVGRPNYAYPVNSLYLDSDRLYTFRDWVNANRNRFKLRMRFYDSREDTPVFLEIKRRVGGCILKERCGIRKGAAPFVLAGQLPPRAGIIGNDAKRATALEHFLVITSKLRAKPKALVTYLREAYIDAENDAVRVTLDRQVRIGPRETCDWSVDMERYAQPFGNKVILELKFNNRFPQWFNQMIHRFELTRSAAAKYCEGMAALHHRPELGSCDPRQGFVRLSQSPDEAMEAMAMSEPAGFVSGPGGPPWGFQPA